jgi:hypothetical protein
VRIARDGEQRASRLRADVRGVDHREARGAQPLLDEHVEDAERRARRALVVLVVAHQRAAPVGRDDLGIPEVPAREGRLPAARRAHQQHERRIRQQELRLGRRHGDHVAMSHTAAGR